MIPFDRDSVPCGLFALDNSTITISEDAAAAAAAPDAAATSAPSFHSSTITTTL